MSTVQLSDVIIPEVFQALPQENGPEKTALFMSGIVTRNPLIDSLADASTVEVKLPLWNDLDGSAEVNYTTDDPTDVATPKNLGQVQQVARKAFVNQGWQYADLVSEIALGPTAPEAIRNKVDKYFERQFQRRVISASNGVLADNVANDSGDMVVDVAVESTGAQTAATLFNRDAFTEAVYTMGDAATALSAIAVHSAVMAQMVKNDDIDFIPDSQGQLTIPTYMGLRVIVDDGLTVTAGSTSGFKYTSIIFGQGAFGYGVGNPMNPIAVERNEAQGNGGGIESLWVRNTWLLHPFGFAQTGTPAAGESFTLAEMAAAAQWNRVLDRKLVPMSFLITN